MVIIFLKSKSLAKYFIISNKRGLIESKFSTRSNQPQPCRVTVSSLPWLWANPQRLEASTVKDKNG